MSGATALSGGSTADSCCFWKLTVGYMKLQPETLYHIYNRGNNKQLIFFQERNYEFFMAKAVNEFRNELDFLAYCLMPNHFHFLVYTKPEFDTQKFSNAMRSLL